MYYVYMLINEAGTVEYVGRTSNPKRRMGRHKCKPSRNKSGDSFGCGRFHGRNDITMEIVKEFGTEREALDYEGQLKLELGFEWTERTGVIKGGKIGGKLGGKTQGRNNVESGHLAKQRELRKQPILAYHKDTGELVGEFASIKEAANHLGVYTSAIHNVLSGKQNHTAGYTFIRIKKGISI